MCVSQIVPGHSESTGQGCLPKLLCLCWMQYVGWFDTNMHPKKSSGVLVFYSLDVHMHQLVVVLALSQLYAVNSDGMLLIAYVFT